MKFNFTTELRRRAESSKIPRSIARAIEAEVNLWLEKSSTEWTVSRLKALKTDFIRIAAGQDRSSEWIKYSNGRPKGAFGRLFKWGHLNPQRTAQTLQVLAMYTAFTHREMTENQRQKFYNSVATEPLEPSIVENLFLSLLLPEVEKLKVVKERLRTVRDFVPSASKRAPTARGGTVEEVVPDKRESENSGSNQYDGWLSTVDVLWDTSLGRQLYNKYPQVRQVVKPIEHLVKRKLSKLPPYFYEEGVSADQRKVGFAGKIGHIQEPGLKLRAVANPFRVYQLSLSRLGAQLYELLTRLPWDVTHDQEAGVSWAQRKLESGCTMFAVDLSDATNVFPLSLQIKVLENLDGVLEEDINLFDDLSTAPWLTPSKELVRWTKGQPLGLFPSFASFALTHGLLVRSLESELGLPEGDNFRILGDDIVISDLRLNDRYREVLSLLEVGVSESKTLTSNQVTEFGGRVIFPTKVISIGKWREISDRSFIDLVKNTGVGYIKYLRPRQRRVAEKIMTLPEPWGLNMNPGGVSALERHQLLEDFLESLDLDYPLYQKDQWIRTLMTSKLASPRFERLSLNGFIHQTAVASGRQTGSDSKDLLVRISHTTGVDIQPSTQLSQLSLGYSDMLERMHSIASSLGLVPYTNSDPRGDTTLEILERRLARQS